MGKGKSGWDRCGKGKWGDSWGSGVFDLGGGVTSEVVHENVTCDGCGTAPICDIRYKSLEWDDYDLCQVCHDRTDRETMWGVSSAHRFQQVPEAPQPSDNEKERLKGVLNYVQSCGIDLKQFIPRAAAVCLGALQPVQEDEDRMVPLIEKLTGLAEMTELSLDQATEEVHAILIIIRSFHWKTLRQFFVQAGFALHGLLAELGVEADMLKMCKGLMKGKCGKGQGKGRGKGWWPDAQHSADAAAPAAAASPEENTSARANADAVYEDALAALLGNENEAVRKAAEAALAKAKQAAVPEPAQAPAEPEPECCAALCGDPFVELLSAVDYDRSPVGDVSRDWASVLAQFPRMRRAFHFGRVQSAAGAALALRLCVANTSKKPWPASTALRIAAGPAQGLPELHVGALGPGDVAELELRLLPESPGRSSWSLEADGEPFGPLLILDAV